MAGSASARAWGRRSVLLLAAALVAGACGPRTGSGVPGALPVVATFSVIGDLVRNVGGDHVALTTLVGPGTDTHTFNPSPADGAALAKAQVVFENGLGFESWLNDLYASSGSQAARVAVTDGVPIINADGQPDPHVWHSVPNAEVMVANIRDALSKADPGNAEAYRANAEAYTAQLQSLDAWIVEQVNSVPAERRKLVTNHDTLGYFAQRYGFQVLGTLLPGSTEGASPSAQQLAGLVEAVKASGVPAVFAENVASNNLIDQVATEAGVKVVASLYTDALGPPGSGADTYLGMLRANVTTIVAALR